MTSVPTTRLRLDLQGTGDNPNTWGLRNNNNISLVEEAVAGVAKVTVNSNVMLNSQNYTTDEARKAVLQLSGTGLAGNAPALITIPAVEKVYQIDNRCAGPVLVGFSAQVAVTCREGLVTTVYSDGTALTADDPSLNRIAKPTGDLDFNGYAARNGADGTSPTDFATVQQTGPFQVSQAKAWANQPSGEVVPGQGYSAFYYAQQAAAVSPSGKASSSQAVIGTDDTAYMTPLKTVQSIAQRSASLNEFRTLAVQVAKLRTMPVLTAGMIADDFRDASGIDPASTNYGFDAASNTVLNYAVDANTLSLMHFDTGLTDEKGNPITVTGSVALSTAQSKLGGASALFSGGYLSGSLGGAFGTGELCLEGFIRPTSVAAAGSFYGRTPTNTGNPLNIRIGTFNGAMDAITVSRYGIADDQKYNFAFAANTWYHIAIERFNGVLTVYVNGTSIGSAANTFDYGTSNTCQIGANGANGETFPGYMDEVRISKVARYKGNFTPPTAPLTITGGPPLPMDLRSIAFPGSAVPSKASILILAKALTGTITPNTNLIGAFSRDGGTTYTTATLVPTGTYGGFVMEEANGFDISGQPSGQSLKYRVQTVGTTLGVALDAVVAGGTP